MNRFMNTYVIVSVKLSVEWHEEGWRRQEGRAHKRKGKVLSFVVYGRLSLVGYDVLPKN